MNVAENLVSHLEVELAGNTNRLLKIKKVCLPLFWNGKRSFEGKDDYLPILLAGKTEDGSVYKQAVYVPRNFPSTNEVIPFSIRGDVYKEYSKYSKEKQESMKLLLGLELIYSKEVLFRLRWELVYGDLGAWLARGDKDILFTAKEHRVFYSQSFPYPSSVKDIKDRKINVAEIITKLNQVKKELWPERRNPVANALPLDNPPFYVEDHRRIWQRIAEILIRPNYSPAFLYQAKERAICELWEEKSLSPEAWREFKTREETNQSLSLACGYAHALSDGKRYLCCDCPLCWKDSSNYITCEGDEDESFLEHDSHEGAPLITRLESLIKNRKYKEASKVAKIIATLRIKSFVVTPFQSIGG